MTAIEVKALCILNELYIFESGCTGIPKAVWTTQYL
jgi:hypothetical protein